MPPHADWKTCSLCQRDVPTRLITLHHLKPRQTGGRAEHRTPLCKPCHKQLHATFSNKELDRQLDSIDAIRQSPVMQTFLTWIRKQKPDRNFKTRLAAAHPASNRQKRRR